MPLTISRTVYDAMLRAAQQAAPLEACGLLGGSNSHSTAFYELANADASADHYRMLPEHQFSAIRDMRARGLRMLAIWHSHPATPARMSDEDLRLAFTPDTVYLILSLASPEVPDLRGFILQDGRTEPVELAITNKEPT